MAKKSEQKLMIVWLESLTFWQCVTDQFVLLQARELATDGFKMTQQF